MKRTLDYLEIGKEGYIKSIECDDKALRRHILDMGLTPGIEVKLIKTAPMGDPLEIRVRGYELTIRKSDASTMFQKDIKKAHFKQKQFIYMKVLMVNILREYQLILNQLHKHKTSFFIIFSLFFF